MRGKRAKKTILFIYRRFSTFRKRDFEILKKHFKVIKCKASSNLIKYVFRLLFGVKNSDLLFIWFADWHAFLAVLFAKFFRKKSVVVAGGYDAACVPEIKYGVFCSWWRGRLAKFVYKNADKILVVDESLKREILKNTSFRIGEKIVTVPTGYDSDRWKPEGKKKDIVLTVGSVSWSNVKRKGFETFVKTARYIPRAKFVLVGRHIDDSINYLRSIASQNVMFVGFVSDIELLKWYQKSKVYCQLSRYEGLPNALCEAMLCGCIPVGTKYCGIPTAIGDTGFYVKYGDVGDTTKMIKKALNAKKRLGKIARERIKKLFPIKRRRKELIYYLKEVLKN